MRSRIASVLAVAIVLGATPAGASRTVEVDRGWASGKFMSASASGSVNDPRALFVQVKSRPTDLRVRVSWNMFCPNGSDAGDFDARTTVIRRLPMPANPDSCTFAATAQLRDGAGRIVVVLLARVGAT